MAPKKTRKNEKRSPAITPLSVLRGASTVLFRVGKDKGVSIIRTDNDRSFFTLDGLAAQFFLLIDGNRSLGAITAKLARKHNLPLGRFERDVNTLVTDLIAHGLVSADKPAKKAKEAASARKTPQRTKPAGSYRFGKFKIQDFAKSLVFASCTTIGCGGCGGGCGS